MYSRSCCRHVWPTWYQTGSGCQVGGPPAALAEGWLYFCTAWEQGAKRDGCTGGLEYLKGIMVPAGAQSTCKSKNLARTCNFSAGARGECFLARYMAVVSAPAVLTTTSEGRAISRHRPTYNHHHHHHRPPLMAEQQQQQQQQQQQSQQ